MFDGKAFGEEIVGFVREYLDKEVAPLKAENDALRERIKALEDRPAPEVLKGDDGKSVEPEVVLAMVETAVSKAIADIPKPKDGKDAAGFVTAVKDNGELVVTLQDGSLLRTGIRDGEKGKDGRDGFGIEDFEEFVEDDDRTVVRRFKSGEYEYESRMKFPVQIYRGVFKEGQEYDHGDVVTWGGSQWHCDKATTTKPGTDDWTMCVKKGRDGKDAKNG